MSLATCDPKPEENQSLEPYLITKEAKEYLKVSTPTIHRWIRAGILKPSRLPGGGLRFRRADLDKVLA
jgi:excisionase family DNA binding protein